MLEQVTQAIEPLLMSYGIWIALFLAIMVVIPVGIVIWLQKRRSQEDDQELAQYYDQLAEWRQHLNGWETALHQNQQQASHYQGYTLEQVQPVLQEAETQSAQILRLKSDLQEIEAGLSQDSDSALSRFEELSSEMQGLKPKLEGVTQWFKRLNQGLVDSRNQLQTLETQLQAFPEHAVTERLKNRLQSLQAETQPSDPLQQQTQIQQLQQAVEMAAQQLPPALVENAPVSSTPTESAVPAPETPVETVQPPLSTPTQTTAPEEPISQTAPETPAPEQAPEDAEDSEHTEEIDRQTAEDILDELLESEATESPQSVSSAEQAEDLKEAVLRSHMTETLSTAKTLDMHLTPEARDTLQDSPFSAALETETASESTELFDTNAEQSEAVSETPTEPEPETESEAPEPSIPPQSFVPFFSADEELQRIPEILADIEACHEKLAKTYATEAWTEITGLKEQSRYRADEAYELLKLARHLYHLPQAPRHRARLSLERMQAKIRDLQAARQTMTQTLECLHSEEENVKQHLLQLYEQVKHLQQDSEVSADWLSLQTEVLRQAQQDLERTPLPLIRCTEKLKEVEINLQTQEKR